MVIYLPGWLMANPPKPDWPLLLEPDHLHFLCHYSPFNATLSLSVGWFGRAMALLPVSEGNRLVGGTHRNDEQYPNADPDLAWSR